MKAPLIVLGIFALQLAGCTLMGKCIRAGDGTSIRAARGEHGAHRASENVDIEPERPVADVVAV